MTVEAEGWEGEAGKKDMGGGGERKEIGRNQEN